MQLWSRPAKTLPIALNGQAIVNSLTENNKKMVWVSRMVRDDELHIIQVQAIAGISLPTTLVVKKFQNENLALQVDDNVKYHYISEMFLLASNSHDNIIKVVDLIQWEDAIMLVYEYPVNGSLQSWLHQPMDAGRPLSWPVRRLIAIGVAKGLCHMHHRCKRPIIHNNINSNNILLDQNFKPVIASFDAAQMNMAGLDQPLPMVGLPLGNFGYAAPEYGVAASELTEKVDTYSFGVLMLELVTGRMANEAGADGHLATWAWKNFTKLMANQQEMFQSAVDRDIPDQARYMKEMATVFMLGVDCTVGNPQQRPSMRMALKRLRRGCGRGPFRGLLTCYLL
ncbi:MDIS1-interacting receptor like kinase 1-like [Triticum urartu]|uniref:Protein kinase domain-containing protein n=2 Tax=Triticum TaxID=4564 RepID=A0A8R7QYK1_TRIUA|nr:MDIS1-interacting receptor like kinase 1-like [Triticum aestivum]XP_044426327.1 MDIS1-interacting receptor like kinase 1-like [Triticum aestivum]XP_048542877.1 MDIS1-interacting receptor like kinase 1-like [Triticum urartu]XP_048542878.1 MDIS1-interacting receptor like kinase 1-like [Triticum urartu]XP_048542879.1 MDIS1-interacting receptor like kinase 1-like [Triticum urartu]XP_048542880.1 MDIS1-interacting receptor like kinase 1-like [Triticum urartu]